MPDAPPRRRKDAQRNRERVLTAAGEVFAELGATAQVEDVARAAGVGVGTIYRHFGSRDELVAALVAHRITGWAAEARAARTAAGPDPWQRFSGLLWSYADSCVTDHQLLDLGCAAVLDLLSGDHEHSGELVALIQETLDEGTTAGVLPATLTVEEVLALMTAIGGVAAVPDLDWRPVLRYALDGIRHAADGSVRLG
ncbi:TetR/AcrR family transcriptional regulator [Amycolatopsis samaneae]|uniref:TetR/AcrR family transcriptional regulator n=1 Tax=Amycolatopsis samaneae TaxID=664691 RepID=A0ABW5GSQ6_9PSEU